MEKRWRRGAGFDEGIGDGEPQDSKPHSRTDKENAPLLFRASSKSSDLPPLPIFLPTLEEPSDAAYLHSSFDPVNLMEVGLEELRDRSLSLQSLMRSRSVAVPAPAPPPVVLKNASVRTPSRVTFNVPDYNDLSKRWKEFYERYPNEGRGKSADKQEERGKTEFELSSEAAPQFTRGFSVRRNSKLESRSVREKPSPMVELPQEYYNALEAAPHASLIHLVSLYHRALINHGLGQEAEKIAELLAGLQVAGQEAMEIELQGMDLLLKEGLLKLYLRAQPYLPQIAHQIVKFKSLTCTAEVQVVDGYDTVFTKALKLLRGPFGEKKRRRESVLLNDVTGYLMPGTLTLVLGPPGCGETTLHNILAGSIPPQSSLEGSITYNGEAIQNVRIERLAALVGQRDIHLPWLTVRETLAFARSCTLAFKATDYGPELQTIMGEALKLGQDPKVEITLSMMGLKRVANRPVGNHLIPTITEDERHRVSAAEMFAGAYAVYFFDQLNTRVEDSVTYDLVTAVRIFTRVRQITVMASLSQPSPEVFDLFDRLILLNQGHIVYQGPREDALPYFESLGYKKPRHLGVGEYLQEVTTDEGEMYLQPGFKKLELGDFVSAYQASDMYKDVCRVVDDQDLLQEFWVQGCHPLGLNFIERKQYEGDRITNFIERRQHAVDRAVSCTSYIVSEVADEGGSLLEISMDHTTNVQPGDELVGFGGATGLFQYLKIRGLYSSTKESLQTVIERISDPVRLQFERPFQRIRRVLTKQYHRDYVLEQKSEVYSLFNREINVTWRGKFGLYIRLFQVVFVSLFLGFLLFRIRNIPNQFDLNLLRTVYFVSVLNMTLFNMGQLPVLMDERAVYYKQQGAHFFRPGSYLLAKIAGSIPFSLCEGTVWALIVYILTGRTFADGGWHFYVYYLVVVLTVLNGAAMTRFFSAFAPNLEKAGLFIGLAVAFLILFAGFLVPRFVVPKYWLWMYYINPMQWAISALMINDLNSPSYSKTLCSEVTNLGDLPQCIGRANNTIGHAFLARGQFYTSNSWIAVAIAVLLAWFVIWNALTYYALAKIKHAQPFKRRDFRVEKKNSTERQQIESEVENASRKLSQIALPITLSWHELSYDVMIPAIGKARTILSYVSGWGESGDMVAILDSGGEGRSTLLNCLAGCKILPDRIGGQILVNGYPKVQKAFASYMGYVDKIDAYTPYMTIHETVAFSAALRLGKTTTRQRRFDFVEEILELLELKHMKDRLVISLVDEVTLEQEKRLAIATELAANPSVLFLDDPTKGLDSLSASHIVDCLKNIAGTGRLVISALRHPSQRILSAFTKAQILKRGGEIVYFGSAGKDGEMIRAYFEAIPGTPLCSPNKSVSSFVIDVIGDGISTRKAVKDYAFEYRVSELALRNHVHLQHLRRSRGQNGPELQWKGHGATYSTMAFEVILKLQHQYWRNVNYSWGRLSFFITMSLILGSLYYKINYHTVAGMNARASSIFISCMLLGVTNAQNVIPQIVRMRAVYAREKASNQYSAFLYNIAWTLAEIPYLAVATLAFCCIFLSMVNMAVDSAGHFFLYWFISLLFFLSVTYFGMLLAVISPMPQIASVLAPMVIGIWVSTGGLVIPKRMILRQFIWIFWTNPLQYALHSLTTLIYFCDTAKPECTNGVANLGCLTDPLQCPACDCPRLEDSTQHVFVWRQIRFNRTLRPERIPYDILALFLFCVVFRFLTYLALKYMKHNRRA